MTRRPRNAAGRKDRPRSDAAPPQPVDVVDGIPDRAENPPRWKYVLIAAVFLAWLGFLIYCAAAGNP